MLTEKITITEKIGNFLSLLLLGNTKETIFRLDEKSNFLQKSLDKFEHRFDIFESKVEKRFEKIENRLDVLQSDMNSRIDALQGSMSAFNTRLKNV
ncbi:MAG: hypothetical protein KGJ35_00015 [Patescibacteria group bacterium]|nr:hypothetical protein [Patescibacteria group bacterium]